MVHGTHIGRRSQRVAWVSVLGVAALALLACSSGPDLESRALEAQQQIQSGSPETAIPILREILEIQPDDPEAQYLLGVALRKTGQSTEALFPLSKAAQSEEYATLAGVVLANTLAEAANHEEAIAAAERVLLLEPENQAALMIRARSAVALKRGELALESAERLLLLSPDSLPLRHLRAQALAEADRTEEAESLYRELMEMEPEDGPSVPLAACIALARLQAAAEDGEERALETLGTCEERFADEPASVQAILVVYDELERSEEARALLERVVEEQPEAVSLRANLATRLVAVDEFDAAEQLMKQSVEEEDSPEAWLALASVRMHASDFEGALRATDEAIARQTAPSQMALFTRADMLLALGRAPEAEVAAAELEPGIYRQTIEARLAHERGDLERALELYDAVLSSWPQNYRLRLFAATAALRVGDADRAKSELLEITRQAPSETDAALWLARVYFAEGNYAEAAGFARRQIRERGTVAPDAHLLGSRAYLRNGQPEAARQLLMALEQARDGRFLADAAAELARATAREQGPAPALAKLEEAVDVGGLDLAAPESEPALVQLFELMVAAGQLHRAQEHATALASGNPDAAILQVMAGRVALLQGDADRAGRYFERALALDAEHAPALAGQALLRSHAGDLAGASELMDAAWAAQRHHDYGYMSARLKMDLGDLDGAEDRFREVLVLHPDHGPTANDLAWLLVERGRSLELARSYAERAVRLSPGPEVLDTLGYIMLQQGEIRRAEAAFRKVLEMKADYDTARYHLALALRETGDLVEAKALLKEALERPFPESAQAQQLLAKLEAGDAS